MTSSPTAGSRATRERRSLAPDWPSRSARERESPTSPLAPAFAYAIDFAFRSAKSIAYAKAGASGVLFAALIQRLGIAGDLQSKSRLTATGEEVSAAVVKGEVELGILPLSEILPVTGEEPVMFPAEVQSYIVMVGGVGAASKHAVAARALIQFLTAPAALPVLEAKGMER